MNGLVRLFALLLAGVLVFLPLKGDLSSFGLTPAEGATHEGVAPDFVLEDLQGREYRMSDYRGRPMFIVFGTTWCPMCRQEIPAYKEIYSRYGPKGLVVLYINVMESQRKAAAYATKHSLPYPVLVDMQGKVTTAYGVRGVPTKILVDRNGKVICRNCRSLDALLLKQF